MFSHSKPTVRSDNIQTRLGSGKRRFMRLFALSAGGTALATSLSAIAQPVSSAHAQSPSPTWYMLDVNSNGVYPVGANAVVIEGLGLFGNCNYSPYTPAQVENLADTWINQGLQVIVEVTPQSGCESIGGYQASIYDLISRIANGAASAYQFSRFFGGLMVDEEPNYGFTYSALDQLNNYVYSNDLFGTKFFTENANYPGNWTQPEYDNLTMGDNGHGYVASPQIYNSNQAGYQNQAMTDLSYYTTLVTCTGDANAATAPWNSCTYAPSQVNGAPWTWSNWGSGYWYNKWQPA